MQEKRLREWLFSSYRENEIIREKEGKKE